MVDKTDLWKTRVVEKNAAVRMSRAQNFAHMIITVASSTSNKDVTIIRKFQLTIPAKAKPGKQGASGDANSEIASVNCHPHARKCKWKNNQHDKRQHLCEERL